MKYRMTDYNISDGEITIKVQPLVRGVRSSAHEHGLLIQHIEECLVQYGNDKQQE